MNSGTAESRGFRLRRIDSGDGEWVASVLDTHWGSKMMVSKGVLHDLTMQPGVVAVRADEPIGLLTYNIVNHECEITMMHSLHEGMGVGSALVDAVEDLAAAAGCSRLWLVTTNDNLRALGFYQKRGFTLAAVYPNALARSRLLKPEISMVGMNGILLRDEIELEMLLRTSPKN